MSLGESESEPCHTLSESLMNSASERQRNQPLLGLTMVTSSALLFGLVAAFVKGCSMPTLVMLQCRSIIEIAIGAAVVMSYLKGAAHSGFGSASLHKEKEVQEEEGKMDHVGGTGSTEQAVMLLVIGPRHLRKWLALRAVLYWAFLACWWYALSCMPIGDATAIVYTGPVFSALFSFIFLSESIRRSFYPIMALNMMGLMLITQPSFIFSASGNAETPGDWYWFGAASSLMSAMVSGMLPVTTRLSKDCFWTAVNMVSSFMSAVIITPISLAIWCKMDHSAWEQSAVGFAHLDERWFNLTTGTLGALPCLLGATITGFMALGLQTAGYQRTEVTKASVMTILEIPFAYLLQYTVFGQEITSLGIMGVALIMSATLLNLLAGGKL